MLTIRRPKLFGQWIVASVVGFTTFTTGQFFSWALPALLKIENKETGFDLTALQVSWIVTAYFAGNIAGPLVCSGPMDSLGRKRSLLAFSTVVVVSWAVTLAWPSAWGLYVARFLGGFWETVAYTVMPVYVGEAVDPAIRGAVGSFTVATWCLGGLYETAVGSYASYFDMCLWSLVPSVLQFFGLCYLPESPYFFLMRGDRRSAEKSLLWLNDRHDEEKLRAMELAVGRQLENRASFFEIFRKYASRRAMIMILILGTLQKCSGLTIITTYASVTLPESYVGPEWTGVLLALSWLTAALVGFRLLDALGRKTMWLLSGAGVFVSMAAATSWFFLRDVAGYDLSSSSGLPLASFAVHGFFYSLGMSPVPDVLTGELFPINVKAKCAALSCVYRSVVAAVVVSAYTPLADSVGIYVNFAISVVATFLSIVYAWFYMIETKKKTLEEIQLELSSTKKHNVSAIC